MIFRFILLWILIPISIILTLLVLFPNKIFLDDHSVAYTAIEQIALNTNSHRPEQLDYGCVAYTAIEQITLNTNSHRPEQLDYGCVKCQIALNTNSHHPEQLDYGIPY